MRRPPRSSSVGVGSAAVAAQRASACIKTVCCRYDRVIHDGPEAPGGGVSHRLCAPHLNEWRREGGLPPLKDAELRAFTLLPAEEAAGMADGVLVTPRARQEVLHQREKGR